MDRFVVLQYACALLLILLPERGRHHNVVCSACCNPDNLLLCETCCRSYHTSCLPPSDTPDPTGNFHCPSCKHKQWDRFLLQAATPDSMFGNAIGERDVWVLASPSMPTPGSDQTSHGVTENPRKGVQASPVQPSPSVDQLPNSYFSDGMTQSSELSTRAKQFLSELGGFAPNQEYSQELLHRLGWMMKEVEFHQPLYQEVQILREENVRLKDENAQMRRYLGPRIPTEAMKAASSGPNSPIPRPPSDTAGKSWDSIVLDLI